MLYFCPKKVRVWVFMQEFIPTAENTMTCALVNPDGLHLRTATALLMAAKSNGITLYTLYNSQSVVAQFFGKDPNQGKWLLAGIRSLVPQELKSGDELTLGIAPRDAFGTLSPQRMSSILNDLRKTITNEFPRIDEECARTSTHTPSGIFARAMA